jgi:hypothetical protein
VARAAAAELVKISQAVGPLGECLRSAWPTTKMATFLLIRRATRIRFPSFRVSTGVMVLDSYS